MAGVSDALWFLREELTCSNCLNYFDGPVTVNCGHSFCCGCVLNLQVNNWFNCPLCGLPSDETEIHVSKQLDKLTEKVQQMVLEANKMGLCELHNQGLTLFCKEDQSILCAICKESNGHNNHTVIPAYEVAEEYEVQLHVLLDTLKRDRKNLSKWEYSWDCSINECEEQAKEGQKVIQNSFKNVHQFLNEEEKELLKQLNRESDEAIDTLKEDLYSLSSMRFVVDQLVTEIDASAQKPTPDLLRDIGRISNRRNSVIEYPMSVPCELQLNYCFPGFLEMLQKYAEPVTLDPNTAHSKLVVTDGGKHVLYRDSRVFVDLDFGGQQSSSERFNICFAVLGNGRFVSGRHYWEIEYELKSTWEMGVCLDTVSRRGRVQCSPEKGFWTILTEDIFYLGMLSTRARIGIFLDYEAGEVTFYSIPKRTVIKTFFDTFTGILRPYFQARPDSKQGALTVCPVTVPQQCVGPAISYIFP